MTPEPDRDRDALIPPGWAVEIGEAEQHFTVEERAGQGDSGHAFAATTEIDFDPETYEPLPVYKPAATRAQIEKAIQMLVASERPLIVSGGGVINADAADLLVEFAETVNVPVVPTLMGWGTIADDHPLMAGMVGLQTSHRFGNATMLASDFVMGIGNRWANRHTGSVDVFTKGRKFVHVDIEPTQIGRVFGPDYGIVSDAKAALKLFVEVARELKAAGRLPDRSQWVADCQKRKRTMLRRTDFDQVPIKPQRVYQEMNAFFGRDVRPPDAGRSAWCSARPPRACRAHAAG